jgi:hypothetical protein
MSESCSDSHITNKDLLSFCLGLAYLLPELLGVAECMTAQGSFGVMTNFWG